MSLHIYERGDKGGYVAPEGYSIPWIDVMYYIDSKRLTEAELAAEYWSAEHRLEQTRGLGGRYTELLEEEDLNRVLTLHRFATNPHYDELDD